MGENFVTIDIRKAFAHKPPELDFVIPGLKTREVGAVVSCGGVGKSFFALNIGVAVSSGYDLSGGALTVKNRGNVTYLTAEEDKDVLENRLYCLGDYLNSDIKEEVATRLKIQSLKGLNYRIMDKQGNPVEEAVEALIKVCEGKRLVVLDTLRRFHLGDENSSADMSQLIAILEGVARATGVTFLYNHHSNKSSASEGKGGEQGASRGSSALVDNGRYQANLVLMTEAEAKRMKISVELRDMFVKLVIPKVNYAAPIKNTWLYRNVGGILTGAKFSVSKSTVRHTGGMEFYQDMKDDDGC